MNAKKYRVLGIARHDEPRSGLRSLTDYAQRLEEGLNELTDAGYSVSIIDQEGGVVIVGIYEEPSKAEAAGPKTLGETLSALLGGGGVDVRALGPEAMLLYRRLLPCVEKASEEAATRAVASDPGKFFAGISVEALTGGAAELERLATEHAVVCKDHECTLHNTLRWMSTVTRTWAAARLQ